MSNKTKEAVNIPLQLANSIMPFILIGIDESAKDEVRNGIAKSIESAISEQTSKLIEALKYARDLSGNIRNQAGNVRYANEQVFSDLHQIGRAHV